MDTSSRPFLSSFRFAQQARLHHQRYLLTQAVDGAPTQYDRADPKNRLVTSQLENRWNAKLEDLTQLQDQLQALQKAATPLSRTDR